MKMVKRFSVVAISAFLLACVTVNVYFPAAAVEQAADRLICEVYGADCTDDDSEPVESGGDDQTRLFESGAVKVKSLLANVVELLIPAAHAQSINIDSSTPAILGLKSRMKQRHTSLIVAYTAGALGMANNGLLVVRDPKLIGIRDRNTVKQLVAEENSDRNALYAEVAKANGHPEWESQIRATFARRWVSNAPGRWWFQDSSGSWKQK